MSAPALEVRGVDKRFGETVALAGVDLTLAQGEIHALLGQNGCGKSTLIKLLAGFHAPDRVDLATVAGRPLALGSSEAAVLAGVRFVHQDLALVGDLDVVDNLALGGHYRGRRWLRDSRERLVAQEHLDGLGIELDAAQLVRDLTPAQRTLVAVARALRDGVEQTRVLVLDEVSATLPDHEVELVFDLVRRIRDRGGSVLFVTHRLEEVFLLADRVTVLRDGRRVRTAAVTAVTRPELVETIVGRKPETLYPAPPVPQSEEVLRAERLRGHFVRGVDLSLHRGEIVGVAGLTGSGREELPELLFGARPLAGGTVTVGGRRMTRISPAAAIAASLALVPSDRAARAAIATMSLRENLTLPRLGPRSLGRLRLRDERADTSRWLQSFGVTPPDGELPLALLSGGNQQKVILARWFRCEPRVLMLDEPTQGVDVGAKAAIYEQLVAGARRGVAVLLASSDHEELAAVCDRVLVLHQGKIAAELVGATVSPDAISGQALGAAEPELVA